MIEKFLEYLQVEKRYSPHTQSSYKKDLEDFHTFLLKTESHEDLCKVDKKIIRNFINHTSQNGFSKRSINRKLSSLRSFYLFLLRIGEITQSPMQSINSIKFYPEKQIPFSKEEMENLQNIESDGSYTQNLKKIIIETLYQTGMRKAELRGLLVQNINFSANEIKVIGKGNKERLIPISEQLSQELKNYSQKRNPLPEHYPFFFITEKGKQVSDTFIYKAVNTQLNLVTSKRKKSPHILRHSFATHILSNGAEISKVKTILGHSSLASTQVYTNADIEQLKKIFNKAHPRSKKD